MSLSQALLPEFDQEMANTRKMLEVVPEGRNDWKPHPKSMTLGRLAGHVAELPFWGVNAMDRTELDIVSPSGGRAWEPGMFTTRAGTLKTFDDNVVACRAAIARATDVDLAVAWTLKAGGKALLTMPRMAVLRTMMLNHLIHHRAQLGVYLRLNDVAIPGPYGPSADQKQMI